jgi:hypothetical protein
MAGDKSGREESARMAELEAKAVAEATATADDSFTPSPSLLNASSPEALLHQVDGPSLSGYEAKESVYVGKSVPVAVRAKMEVPIHVTAPGSIIEYSIESKGYDINFAVVAEREEGTTVVKVSQVQSYTILLYRTGISIVVTRLSTLFVIHVLLNSIFEGICTC